MSTRRKDQVLSEATNRLQENMDLGNDVEDEGDDDSWEEENTEQESTMCLFCEDKFKSVELAIKHIKSIHQLDFHSLKLKFNMDQYSYIKLINYIRQTKISPEDILKATEQFWNFERYLKPVLYEPWLTFDFEALISKEADKFDMPEDYTAVQYFQMKNMIEQLIQQLKEKDTLLEQAAKDIEKMRSSFNLFIENEVKTNEEAQEESVGRIKTKADEGYFSSYSHYGIHHEMLSDDVRTLSYRDAILKNSEFLKGKSVLDVGCGTAILSMFASQAGSEQIVAIDNSEIIYHAMDIVRTNNIQNVKFVKGKLEDTELPIDKFDVIISEWMGYFLLFEGMLDSIIYARNRHLKLGGVILPNRCNISLVGYGDENRHKEFIEFWKNVYGFNMVGMQKEVLREAVIEICKPEYVLTEPNIIADYDISKVDYNYSNFSYNFNLKVIKPGKITSFVGYFDTFFDLPNKVSFSTSPESKATHWKQVVFFLKDPVCVNISDIITGKIICKRDRRDLRALNITLEVFQQELHYNLD